MRRPTGFPAPFPATLDHHPWLVGVALVAALALAMLLSGCKERVVQLGDLRVTTTSLLTNDSLHYACTLYSPDGTPQAIVNLDDATKGDTASIHELGQIALSAQAQLGKAAAAAGGVPMAAAPQAARPLAPLPPACVGQRFNTDPPAPFPPPQPAPTTQDDDHPSLMPLPRAGPRSEPLS